ncbi:hypothetical protein SI859A1_00942 [Aurantimonas manganoxydans SI85-9A1]|uniref:Uncharacterized protein n=1 Tax=Aurantimonas manganoxydans (strain ATCC BAA-1229 / DSM 21871 / SI85-9A1) TaxID=287752 RepID=Q1YJQ6_AURMS|nr:hypothetical protein [Aurantimonas manganoxydans]EAS50817.1 hypothetical protein SI859A1_00942 [Aurantimonas manganoxydans SI85-9A1]
MIASGLIFLFGFLAAALIALLVSPIVWRRAKRLARREFEATIPVSANEIRASYDHVRAQAAMESRRREMEAHAVREKAALERAEAGRVAVENADLRGRNRVLTETVAQNVADLKELSAALEAREQDYRKLEEELRETIHDLDLRTEEMNALSDRFRDLTGIAEDRKLSIVSLETRLEEAQDEVRSQERIGRERDNAIDRLRSQVGPRRSCRRKGDRPQARGKDHPPHRAPCRPGRAPVAARRRPDSLDDAADTVLPQATRSHDTSPDDIDRASVVAAAAPVSAEAVRRQLEEHLDLPAHPLGEDDDEEALRERISDIAARVIHLTGKAEGPDSVIERILAADDSGQTGTAESGRPTLAGRVRRLRAEESKTSGQAAE